ncbi:MAG: F0F1 ATP synthase subunit epsilon [Lachnospiraceae bacterium]
MNTFQVYILAADFAFYEGPCESLIVPTLQGQYGILPNHSNMIGAVIPGTLIYKLPEEPEKQAVDEAKEAILQKKSIQEYRSVQANLARAVSRLRVKNSYECK